MIPTIKISQILIDKITKLNESSFAKLYGVFFENTTILLTIQVDTKKECTFQNLLPTEIDCCGVLSINDGNINHSDIIRKLSDQIDVTDNPILLSRSLDKRDEIISYKLVNGKLQLCEFTIINEEEIYDHLVYIRLTGCFSIDCNAEKSAYEEAILDLRNLVTTGNLAFHLPKTPIYLLGTGNPIGNNSFGSLSEPVIGDICEKHYEEDNGEKKRNKKLFKGPCIVEINMLRKTTKEATGLGDKEHAPICFVTKKKKQTTHIPVKVDVLSLISKQTNINILYDVLVESVVKNLKAFHLTIMKNFENNEDLILPEVYHFYPNDCGHFITIWMPKDVDQNNLESSRRALHEKYLLQTRRPLFKRENKHSFEKLPEGGPLINPHEYVKTNNNGGTVALVKGKYTYYHYNQNRMNDSGWGCAYRSLQTLASWFKWQGYTNKDVPTFEEIQKCLVDIEDKPASFMGSTQWIGSMEVSFVLDTLLGVTSRINNVSNGAQMAYEGPELIRHFEQYGCPIMIGGSNLAHTILGVDYNETTGHIKFLILDPHYTGSDDNIQTIINKGWCGWKGIEFWNKTSYYNMCLPIVPSGV